MSVCRLRPGGLGKIWLIGGMRHPRRTIPVAWPCRRLSWYSSMVRLILSISSVQVGGSAA